MEINGVSFKETASSGTNPTASLGNTFDTFLLLLTAQLQNQDPLDPVDSSKFTEQLVQFAGVEQAIATNTRLDQLLELQTGNRLSDAVSFLGRTVAVTSDRMLLDGGAARMSYTLDRNSATTTINIADESGRTVRTFSGVTSAGQHALDWDGQDANGQQLSDGIYGFTVSAVDADGNLVDSAAASIGRVTSMEMVDGVVTLKIGALAVPLDSVVAVREDDPGV